MRYSLVGRQAVGAIALFVYARDDTVAPRVKAVEINTVGCGVLGLLGNKGAVGIRVTLRPDGPSRADDGDDDARGDSSWTFVSAHFAAHQDENEARSNDWRNVVRRLVLQDGSRETQLFDTGHLFFCGVSRHTLSMQPYKIPLTSEIRQDLNYRISLTSPTHLDRKAVSDDVGQLARAAPDAPPSPRLLAQDQLRQEQQRGVTLHHLREGEITFPPTYKYKPGSRDELSSKRVPGWCDRVLYASAAGEEVDVASYTSVMDFTRSDHKPVRRGTVFRARGSDPFLSADPEGPRTGLGALCHPRQLGNGPNRCRGPIRDRPRLAAQAAARTRPRPPRRRRLDSHHARGLQPRPEVRLSLIAPCSLLFFLTRTAVFPTRAGWVLSTSRSSR